MKLHGFILLLLVCLITSLQSQESVTRHSGQVHPYVKFAFEEMRNTKKFQMPDAYSATLILYQDGKMNIQKVFVDQRKWRADQILENREALTLIMRDDIQTYFSTKTGVSEVLQIDYSPQATKNPVKRLLLPLYADNKFRINESEVDFIGDRVCQKILIDSRAGNAILWVDRSHWTPVRLSNEDGSLTVDFKDFKLGRQQPNLFEVPANTSNAKKPTRKN